MSPPRELMETIRAINVCVEEIRSLKHRAIYDQEIFASLALIEIAVNATRTVHDLWFERQMNDPLLCERELDEYLFARREMLTSFVGANKDFPTLHRWDGKKDRRQAKILRLLQFGTAKNAGRKGFELRQVLDLVVAHFQRIQFQPIAPPGIEGKIYCLPSLRFETRSEWAKLIVKWLEEKNPRRLKKGLLFRLANPERELERDKRKAEKRLEARRAKWKAESGGSKLSEILASRFERERGRINRMPVTMAHIRNGLKEQIIEYWGRNLLPGQSPP